MSWLTPKLDRVIDLCKPTQTPLPDGSFERDFDVILSIWAGIYTLNPLSYVRKRQINEVITHKFIVRRIAIEQLIGSENPIKGNYFIFLRQWTTKKGRRFAIKNILDHEEKREYYEIFAEELEEDVA